MKKIMLRILMITGLLLGVLVVLLICLFVFLGIDENRHKNLIASELDRIGAPAGCTETQRQYQSSGIDTVSEWDVDYNCAVSNGQVYQSIADKLKPLGYKVTQDYTKGGPYLLFDVTYKSDKYLVEYMNMNSSGSSQSFSVGQKDQFDAQIIPAISMSIQEN